VNDEQLVYRTVGAESTAVVFMLLFMLQVNFILCGQWEDLGTWNRGIVIYIA